VGDPDTATKAQVVTPDGKRVAFEWDAETIIAYANAVAADFTQEKGGNFNFKPESVKEAVNKKAAEKEKKKSAKTAQNP
jgi:hypothetical protein